MVFRPTFARAMRIDDFPLHPTLLQHNIRSIAARAQHCRGPASTAPRHRPVTQPKSAMMFLGSIIERADRPIRPPRMPVGPVVGQASDN